MPTMLKRLPSTAVSIATAASFLMASTPAALAQSADTYDPHTNFGQSSEVSASVYARVPFNGGLKRSANEEARFGIAVRARLPQKFSYAPARYGITPQYNFQPSFGRQVNVLDLSIGPNGFRSFKLNGHSFRQINALYADEEGEGKKRSAWPWVLLGGAVVFGAIAITAIAKCDNDGPFGTTRC